MAQALTTDSAAAGITSFGLDDPRQGIVHVVGPEQGLSLPGMLIVCGDSHTSTHGALGALAFGIGATEVTHVLATQSLWQRRPKTMRITVDGRLGPGVCAKDVMLAIIARIGAAGAAGHVIEYAGSAITAPVDGRPAHGLQHVDRSRRARGHDRARTTRRSSTWPAAPTRQQAANGTARSRAGARCPPIPARRSIAKSALDAADIEPMVTWGTSPEDASPITGRVPDPADAPNAERRDAIERALAYMGLQPGTPLTDVARRSRVRRLVHQRTHRGPAQRGGGRGGPQGRIRRRGVGRSRARAS